MNIQEILAKGEALLKQSGMTRKEESFPPQKEFRASNYWPIEGKVFFRTLLYANRPNKTAYVDLFAQDPVLVDKLKELMPECEIVVHTHSSEMPCYAVDECKRVW